MLNKNICTHSHNVYTYKSLQQELHFQEDYRLVYEIILVNKLILKNILCLVHDFLCNISSSTSIVFQN